jgi:hypothetical protein
VRTDVVVSIILKQLAALKLSTKFISQYVRVVEDPDVALL